jgi:hypothetical protein
MGVVSENWADTVYAAYSAQIRESNSVILAFPVIDVSDLLKNAKRLVYTLPS